MARPKKLNVELNSLDDCAQAMTDLLMAITDLEILTAERDMAVAAAQKKFETRMDDAKVRKSDNEEALQAYYMSHLDEIEKDGRKSIQLANGVMGRRDNPDKLVPLNRNWTLKAIKIRVRSLWNDKYFHEPKEPELDKDKLKAELGDEDLKKAGLKKESDETFYIEPTRLPKEAK